LKAIQSDPAVKEIESDSEVKSGDRPAAAAPAIDLGAIAAAILDHATVSYYGATVRASYVQQPAAGLIHRRMRWPRSRAAALWRSSIPKSTPITRR
jgi:hypothetical protein